MLDTVKVYSLDSGAHPCYDDCVLPSPLVINHNTPSSSAKEICHCGRVIKGEGESRHCPVGHHPTMARIEELEKALDSMTKDRDEKSVLAFRYSEKIESLEAKLNTMQETSSVAMRFIHQAATGKRSDGTYNYSREALEQQAKEIISKLYPTL